MNKIISLSFFLLLCFTEVLKSQEDIYIPYRSGMLWGYADTNANIVIPPIYNHVLKQERNMFLVEKGNKKGVVTLENKVVTPFEEGIRISLTNKYILSEKVSYQNRQGVSSQIYQSIVSGRRTFPPEITSISGIELANKKYYKVHTKTGKQGLVKVREDYDGIEKWIIDTSFIQIKNTWSLNYVLLEKDGVVTKFSPGLTSTEMDSMEKINYLSEVPDEMVFEEIDDKNRIESIWKSYALLKLENKNTFQLIVQKRWSEKNKKPQIHYDTLPSEFLKVDIFTRKTGINNNDSIDYQVNHKKQLSIAIVTGTDGKKGVVNSFGKLVVPIMYDSISNNLLFQGCQEVNLICYKNNKCGLVDIQNKVLIPFEFDQLFLDAERERKSTQLFQSCFGLKEGIVARKKSKFGIVNQEGEILGFQFDNIKYIGRTKSFQLKQDGKYGILQSERSLHPKKGMAPAVLIDPVFLFPVDGILEISGYLLGIVLNHGSRIKGYVDTKGFNYFNE